MSEERRVYLLGYLDGGFEVFEWYRSTHNGSVHKDTAIMCTV